MKSRLPRTLVHFVALLHAAVATNITGFGSQGCPCITYSQGTHDIFNASAVYNSSEPNARRLSYGIGCAKHDETPPFIDGRCGGHPPPKFCGDAWCYVFPDCQVLAAPSAYRLGRWYSYATCGYVDHFQTALQTNAWYGKQLNVIWMSNTGGWKGSYCSKATGICTGPVYDLLQWALAGTSAIVNTLGTTYGSKLAEYPDLFPPEVLHAVELSRPNEGIVFPACYYATAMGYTDLCLVALAQLPERTLLTEMIPLYSDPVYFIATTRVEQTTFAAYLGKAFKPFKPDVWVAIVTFLILASLALIPMERMKHGMYERHTVLQCIVHASFNGLKSFVDAGCGLEAQRVSGRFITLGIGFFCLLTVSAYTANLATFLIVDQKPIASISSWESIVGVSNLKVCALWSMQAMLLDTLKFPGKQIVFKAGRMDVVRSIGTSECAAGVVGGEDLAKAQESGDFCNLVKVGEPLYSRDYGAAVSKRAAKSLEYFTRTAQAEGVWTRALREHRPRTACALAAALEKETAEYQGMGLTDMVGPTVISIFLVMSGIAYELGMKVMGHVGQRLSLRSLPSASWGDHDTESVALDEERIRQVVSQTMKDILSERTTSSSNDAEAGGADACKASVSV